MEAIILAGGMGTRLRSVVSDMPKSMAPVAGNPFLFYLLQSMESAGFDHIILAVGYKHEVIEDWLSTYQTSVRISLVLEEEPLGTGGAVRYALCQAKDKEVFVVNGDTFFDVDYPAMLAYHRQTGAEATLALKQMTNFDRYGAVLLNKESRITLFREKQYCESGMINGGIYILQLHVLRDYPEKFSLEKDYFEKVVGSGRLTGFPSKGYFIDIGIPADYEQAQADFKDGKYKTI